MKGVVVNETTGGQFPDQVNIMGRPVKVGDLTAGQISAYV